MNQLRLTAIIRNYWLWHWPTDMRWPFERLRHCGPWPWRCTLMIHKFNNERNIFEWIPSTRIEYIYKETTLADILHTYSVESVLIEATYKCEKTPPTMVHPQNVYVFVMASGPVPKNKLLLLWRYWGLPWVVGDFFYLSHRWPGDPLREKAECVKERHSPKKSSSRMRATRSTREAETDGDALFTAHILLKVYNWMQKFPFFRSLCSFSPWNSTVTFYSLVFRRYARQPHLHGGKAHSINGS